jgi:TolA-binding protein
MGWPFTRKEKMVPIGPVALTDDERQEAEAMLRSLAQARGGDWLIREDVQDAFQRSIIAMCLMARADRFIILSQAEAACQSAAKACAVFPVSIYFYDFGCILTKAGKAADARKMFQEFLRRYRNETPDAMMRITLSQRDMEAAVRHAQGEA